MLELLAVFFVCRDVGRKAREKGRSVWLWRFAVIVFWLGFEVAGFVLGMILFHERGPLFAYGFAMVAAMLGLVASYLLLARLPALPDTAVTAGAFD